jgi:AcrR family transcriptional regulator
VARIIDEADVSKMTFYRHFKSKDDLVVAVLERREEVWTNEWFRREVRDRGASPHEQLLAIFDVFDEWFRQEDFEGCFFISSLLESHDRSSRMAEAAIAAIAAIRDFVRDLAASAGIEEPDRLAHQWQLLMRGAIVAAGEGDLEAARRAQEVAKLLLDHR